MPLRNRVPALFSGQAIAGKKRKLLLRSQQQMSLLKQSTVATVYVGPILDSAGAAVTTAVVGDFRIIKNGTAATLSGATVTHDSNGYYTVALTTGNTDTLGQLSLAIGNSTMSMAVHTFSVLLSAVHDFLIGTGLSVMSDNLLSRNVSNVEATAPEHSLATAILLLLEHAITGTVLTIRRTDGTTTHYTKTLTTNPSANPITGIQ